MKPICLLITLLAGVHFLHAQDCSTLFAFEEGVQMEYQNFTKKDKLEGTTAHLVESVESLSGGGQIAVVQTKVTDAKGKNTTEGSFVVECDGQSLKLDVSDLLPEESMQAFASLDVEIEGDGFLIPTDLKVGETIPDSENVIKVGMEGMNMNIKFNIRDHKVEAKETVQTPAGSFDCYKLSYIASIKIMGGNNESKVVTWYAPNVGTVKSETFNAKNDKLMSKMVLSKFSK